MSELSIVALMRSGVPLREQDAMWVGRIIAQQLAGAHAQGVTHGDVGPHTVFVTVPDDTSGRLSAATLSAPRATGRPSDWPLAPEVHDGVTGTAADVFALGHLIRAMCAYAAGPSVSASTSDDPRTANGGAPRVPLVVTSMVALDPDRRPTMQRVIEALGEDGTAHSLSPVPAAPPLLSTSPAQAAESAAVSLITTPSGRRRPVVLGLVATLVLAAALAGGYWWMNRSEPATPSASGQGSRQDLPARGDDTAGLTAGEPSENDPSTDEAASTTPQHDDPGADDSQTGVPADASAARTTATVTPTAPGVSSPGSASSESADTRAPSESVDPSTTSEAVTPRPGTDRSAGADADTFDAAYCRVRGTFVALADTASFRTIICSDNGTLTYHGLNRADGLTITTPAVSTSSGWTGTAEAGGVYEVSASEVRVLQGTRLLASEEVHTFVDTSDTGTFRPGDLDLREPISYPSCDGAGVVIIESFVGSDVGDAVQASLDSHPGSSYLRTDLSCDNFNRPSASTGGANIYATYFWVGYDQASVCATAESVGSYAYWLQDGVDSGNIIDCG